MLFYPLHGDILSCFIHYTEIYRVVLSTTRRYTELFYPLHGDIPSCFIHYTEIYRVVLSITRRYTELIYPLHGDIPSCFIHYMEIYLHRGTHYLRLNITWLSLYTTTPGALSCPGMGRTNTFSNFCLKTSVITGADN